MAVEKIQVPDIGDDQEVEVIEILVSPGDEVSENDSLIVLESDKAAMEIPSPKSGVIKEVFVKIGAQVSQGIDIVSIELEGSSEASAEPEEESASQTSEISEGPEGERQGAEDVSEAPASVSEAVSEPDPIAPQSSAKTTLQEIKVPDLGEDGDVDVIEILVSVGDEINKEDGLVTLETDKAAMEVPSPAAGIVKAIKVKVGDKVSEGSVIIDLEAKQEALAQEPLKTPVPAAAAPVQAEKIENSATAAPVVSQAVRETGAGTEVHAGPAVRKLARELGVDLSLVSGTGARARIVKEDVHSFVKTSLQGGAATASTTGNLPGIEDIDFSKFGEIEEVELSKMHRLTAQNMTRNWLNVPHVTQFDEVDITDLEDFRQQQKALAEKKGIKLTPLPFIIKACAQSLIEHPQFNVSLHSSGAKLIQKKYINIGVAVATPAGLMVPVVKNVDKKSIWQIAQEIAELGAKAKERKLSKDDMQGACFTISSLGNLGGTGFTPIVNAPEVAILGVSRTAVKPVFVDGAFVPRKMLPFALSYDHRAVNGVDGGMFCTYLAGLLADIRLLAL